MVPWTGEEMKKKGAKRMYSQAAAQANAILASPGPAPAGITKEGLAIATALKRVNKTGGSKKRRRRFPK